MCALYRAPGTSLLTREVDCGLFEDALESRIGSNSVTLPKSSIKICDLLLAGIVVSSIRDLFPDQKDLPGDVILRDPEGLLTRLFP